MALCLSYKKSPPNPPNPPGSLVLEEELVLEEVLVLEEELRQYDSVEIWLNTTAAAIFSDRIVGVVKDNREYRKIKPKKLMIATTVSMSRLVGSIRKPKGTLMSPDISHRPIYSIGCARRQPAISKKTDPTREIAKAAIDKPAESRG